MLQVSAFDYVFRWGLCCSRKIGGVLEYIGSRTQKNIPKFLLYKHFFVILHCGITFSGITLEGQMVDRGSEVGL